MIAQLGPPFRMAADLPLRLMGQLPVNWYRRLRQRKRRRRSVRHQIKCLALSGRQLKALRAAETWRRGHLPMLPLIHPGSVPTLQSRSAEGLPTLVLCPSTQKGMFRALLGMVKSLVG